MTSVAYPFFALFCSGCFPYFVYVALDEERHPTPVPTLILQTEDEQRRFEQDARAVRLARLARLSCLIVKNFDMSVSHVYNGIVCTKPL
ncbi:MAG: hypothetical protein R2867_00950 [Caldilineaceae bacterium]